MLNDPDKKVKMARRVAKDMEKWAKAQNKSHKSAAAASANSGPPQAPPTAAEQYSQLPPQHQAHTVLGADIAFSMLERKVFITPLQL